MKQLTSMMLMFTLMLSAIAVPVYADNKVQRVCGQLTAIGNHSYTITDEDGTEMIAKAAADGIVPSLGAYAWFTLETRTDEDGDYLCITGYEILPEYGYEIGYLSKVYEQAGGVYIELFTDKQENMRMYTVSINDTRYRGSDMIDALKPQTGKFIGYKLDEDGDINKIVFVDTKTPTEKYKVNTDTKYFIKNGAYYQIGNLPDGYTYSYEVLSYDKEYNARFVVVTDMYQCGMELYLGKNDVCDTRDENGNINHWEYSDNRLFDGIPVNSMIEFTYNETDGIKSVKALEGIDFQDYTYDKGTNTFGDYRLDSISLLTVEFDERTGNIKTYEPMMPNDNLQYCGKIFTSSYGKNVFWITGNAPIAGSPNIAFWAHDNSSDNTFRVGATYEKNGYTGSGTIYLAVYYQGRLYRIYTYSLADKGSSYDEDGELTSVICDKRIPYEEGTNSRDYTVTGFVLYDNLAPMYPAAPVWE